jgi:adenylyltransferase/sulfurtransferase
MVERYQRQMLLPMIGTKGQSRLRDASVVVLGCGALGTVAAELLARAGAGSLRLIDRDIVEPTNLQRQTLFDESDAANGHAKAVAAANRLRAINSMIVVDPVVADVTSRNIERLCLDPKPTVVIDGTDNADTRYLLNDACVKHAVPWVYGGAVGTEGRVMPVRPGIGPCLRCIFPDAPAAGTLDTCDTVGVLGTLTATVAAMQSAAALRIIVGESIEHDALVTIDGWTLRSRAVSLREARQEDCLCCVARRFEFLDRVTVTAARMCGRSTVQFPLVEGVGWTENLLTRLRAVGVVRSAGQVTHFEPNNDPGLKLTLFADGRVLVHGVKDVAVARSVVARYLGV